MNAAFTSWKIEERHILRRRARETNDSRERYGGLVTMGIRY
jgi:hypothetical protein